MLRNIDFPSSDVAAAQAAAEAAGEVAQEAGVAAAAAQDTADQALVDASTEWVPVTIGVPTNTSGSVPCPVTGTLTAIRASANFVPDASMLFYVLLGGIAAGTVTVGTDHVIDNVVAGVLGLDVSSHVLSAARVAHDGAMTNTVAGQVTILLGFTRTP